MVEFIGGLSLLLFLFSLAQLAEDWQIALMFFLGAIGLFSFAFWLETI